VPFAGLSIRHVKIMYRVLEIIPSPQQMVMWRVQLCWQVQEYWTSYIFTYNRPPFMLIIILLMIHCCGIEFPQLYINNSYPNCQFAGLTYTGWCYWYHVLSRPERDQLQNCIDIAHAKLENWHKANTHRKLNQMCHKQ
jgi:hypothetical protein